jgi:PAS domain S-box-containing protein
MSEPRYSEAQLRSLLDCTSDVVSVVDENGTVTWANAASERFLGYDLEDFVGAPMTDFVHPDDIDTVVTAFQRLAEGETSSAERVEHRARHADGYWVWVESTAAPHDNTDIDGFVVTTRDIDDRRRLEARFRRFVEHSSDILNLIDGAGVNQYVSPSVERISGHDPDDLIGESSLDYIHPDDVDGVIRKLQETIATPNHTAVAEYRFETADGDWVWLESRGRNVADDPGIEGDVLVNSRDISERKRREQELRRENARLDEFADIVSHDLRNPLSIAVGRLELAANETDSPHVDTAIDALGRMESIIEDVLSLAREGAAVTDPDSVDVAATANAAWNHVDGGGSLDTDDAPEAVAADRTRIQRVFENLFRNAVEHGGDDVTVEVGRLDDGFYVADDGPGIPVGDRDTVFDSSFSTTEDGAGLGLTIVKRIADAHDWTVEVRQPADTPVTVSGACFAVTDVEFTDD